jgi:LuxR family transcriptional regulator
MAREIAAAGTATFENHAISIPFDNPKSVMVLASRLVGHERRYEAAAAVIETTESALAACLSIAREKLGARTTAEALRTAREYRLT